LFSFLCSSPIAALGQKLGKLLEILLVFLVKAGGEGAVDVNNGDGLSIAKLASVLLANWHMKMPIGTYLSANYNRHNNLTPAIGITGNVTGELQYIRDNDSLLVSGSRAADTLSEADLLAGGLAVEGSEEQDLVFVGCVGCRDGYTTKARCAGERGRRNWRGQSRELVIANIETGPVDGRRWGREGGVGVPEEGGDVRQVAGRRVNPYCLLCRVVRCNSEASRWSRDLEGNVLT
jgi:hypothetical protein